MYVVTALKNICNDHNEYNEYHNDRCTVASVRVCESIGIEKINDGLCLIKSKVCLVHNHEHKVEYRKSSDNTGLYDEECRRAQQRYCDVEELANACSSVDLSSFIHVGWGLTPLRSHYRIIISL